ncbi:MAG: purine-nucleoside phosphorylase [Tissierellia bacterium]|jgi:purine-nucleoside phosphorylase|nr:purine-nucleoside phosphorylase [Tissierellia bacterium]
MTTAHNSANKGEIAETILLPGDPLRAKYIADNYLDDVKQFNSVRNMFGYTGTYKGKEISVMGTGMGLPSMAIYSYELIHFFGVKNLIRIGSCGSYDADVKIHDIILCQGSCTDSNYAYQYDLPGTYSAIASFNLLEKAKKVADEKRYPVHVGNILSSDVFYDNNPDVWKKWAEMGVLGVEMESYALYCNAAKAGVNALTILTVSDSLVSKEQISAQDRESTFTKMMEIALELA